MILEGNQREKINIKNELLSGLTVAIALVPEAIAFAFVAGVEPLVGLYAAFIVGFITAIFGGRPGMISGATGALAVVMVELVASHGVEYLFLTVIVMGIIQIIIGLLKLGKFVRFMPQPVMIGFVNGLAIVIGIAQLGQFKIKEADGSIHWMTGSQLWTMIALVLATMAIIKFLPKLTKAVPSGLAAIVIVYFVVNILGIDTKMVGDVAKVGGGFPMFSVPEVPFSLESLRIVLPYSVILASIGLIESLMTLTRIDEITETRGRENKECIGQGLANIVTGFFGGMGGCAMIGQSMINISSGGRKRLSGLSASLFLITFILFGSSLIEKIPLAALTGLMFMVVIGTFEWSSFKIMKNIPKGDAFVIVLVSVVTVFTDLAIAVGLGIIVSALVFAWKKGKNIDVTPIVNEEGIKEYHIRGALFFASARNFIDAFEVNNDSNEVIIDFKHARVFDHSAIEAINNLTEKYNKCDKILHLRHLSEECRRLIKDADKIVEVNIMEDPKYKVADDILA
ncbi:MAG: SulP family inorganic anion transporter [Clostridiaceae bacterium]